jgi:signal transduction histidine kinase
LLEPSAEAGPVAVRPDHAARTAAAACPADDAPSLAHDACNLLSALGLYGELLAFPGVLEPRDRHYAEELKLLAARSEVLIGRLLHAGRVETAATDLSAGNLAVGNAAVGAAIGAASVTSNSARTMETASPARHHVSPMTAVEDPASGEVGSTVRADAGGVPVGPRPQTNLVDLLMRWGSLLSTLAHGTLEVAFGPGAATPVAAGAEPLERILVNLVRNARAATVAGGSIRITVGVRPGVRPGARPGAGAEAGDGPQVVVLTVDDSGCGMTAEQLGRVLNVASGGTVSGPDPVAHHAAANTQVPGRRRGLGLQIVRELVAASGGELFAESRLGTGTRIEIHWPVRGAGAGSAAPPVRTDPTARTETTAGAAAAAHGAVSERPSAGPVLAPELLAPNTWARGEANPGAHVTAGADLAVEVAANLAVGLTAEPPTGSPTEPPTESPAELPAGSPTQPAVAAETTAAVRPWPKVSPMAGPPRARAAEPAAVPLERTAVGPDGFTEEQLRTMMLRLHRSAPDERPGERPAERPDARPDSRWSERIGGRIRAGTGYRPGAPAAQAAEGRPGPSRTAPGGATGATALDAGLDARTTVGLDVGLDAGRDDSPRQGTNRGATEDSALKGAIAC